LSNTTADVDLSPTVLYRVGDHVPNRLGESQPLTQHRRAIATLQQAHACCMRSSKPSPSLNRFGQQLCDIDEFEGLPCRSG
jgi:hypothetical protein